MDKIIRLSDLRAKKSELYKDLDWARRTHGATHHFTEQEFENFKDFDDAISILFECGILTMNEYESIAYMTTEELERQ